MEGNTISTNSVGDSATAALLAAAVTSKGVGVVGENGYLDQCIMNNVADLRHDVGEGVADLRRDVGESMRVSETVKADIRESIQNESIRRNNADLSLHNRLCESEKAGIEAKYESQIRTLEVAHATDKNVDDRFEKLRDVLIDRTDKLDSKIDLTAKRIEDKVECVEEKLCDFERRTTKEFAHTRERELIAEKQELRDRLQATEHNSILAAIRANCGGAGGGELPALRGK